ncbi:hypothetical protein [Lentibacillus salicampi]|uniref:Uncharacterized protein n=1 Tax=Lentibacillus salicampi TaxID=175306 RepID=A0A4Y9AAV2_9BACI|nr:hypothetical protein [Lentibacillus salicampi]TFJ93039.1 hypothetical protein E4U82_09430 [Lentibacillus salicampi]
MKSLIKHPIFIAILVLIAYVIAIVLWNIDLTLGALQIVFANSAIGIYGVYVSGREIKRAKGYIHLLINILCLMITITAALIPLIAFIYVDIYGF